MLTKTITLPQQGFQQFVTILTTGLSPKKHRIVGLGVLSPCSSASKLVLYLSEEPGDEKHVLSSFSQNIADNLSIIGYNVKQYTHPFLKERAHAWGLPLPAGPWKGLREQVAARRSLDDTLADESLSTALGWAHFQPDSTILPADVPELWKEFHQSGDTMIADVLWQRMVDDLRGMQALAAALDRVKGEEGLSLAGFTFYPTQAKLIGDRLYISGEIIPSLEGYFIDDEHQLQCFGSQFSLLIQGQTGLYDRDTPCVFVELPWEEAFPQSVTSPDAITLLSLDGQVQKNHLRPVTKQALSRFFHTD